MILKFFLVSAALGFGTLAIADQPQAHGKYHLLNAGCNNPSYVPSLEEKAFIDAIRHVGDLWTDDWLEFTDSTHGQWISDFTQDGMTCRTTSAFTVEAIDQHFRLQFSPGTAQVTNPGTNPNASISCSDNQNAQEDYSRIDVSTDSLDLVSVSDAKCGEFHFHFAAGE